jgi:hypothetical protein
MTKQELQEEYEKFKSEWESRHSISPAPDYVSWFKYKRHKK